MTEHPTITAAQADKLKHAIEAMGNASVGERVELDIDMPTPEEIAIRLEGNGFTAEQASAVAAEVYQPIRNMLRMLMIPKRY